MDQIRALVRSLAAQPARTRELLDAFVAEHEFPLCESDSAVFFYWDGRPLDALYLIHWVFGLESRQAFQKLGPTDAWFLALDLPPGARVEYKLEVQRSGQSELVRDPLNPRQAFDPFGSNSVLPMPLYAEPPWTAPEPGVRAGRLESFPLDSAVYGDRREVAVYLPAEYRPHKRYPVVVCHDGSDYRRFAGAVTVLDNLIHRHEVRPLIVAFTDGVHRNEEYGANPLQPAFLVDDVLPALAARYPISDDPDERGLMGASFGGVSTLFTAWNRPGVFRRLLLQSGSFVFTDVGHHGRGPLWDPVVTFVNAFRDDPSRIDARIYMSCGRFESLIAYNRALVPLLRRSGLAVRFRESLDGHNWISWRDRLRDGLTWLFPGHLWMTYE